MNIHEFAIEADIDLSVKDSCVVTALLSFIEKTIDSDAYTATVYAAGLIRRCKELDIDPMDVVAFVEESADESNDDEDTLDALDAMNIGIDEEGYLFWGVR